MIPSQILSSEKDDISPAYPTMLGIDNGANSRGRYRFLTLTKYRTLSVLSAASSLHLLKLECRAFVDPAYRSRTRIDFPQRDALSYSCPAIRETILTLTSPQRP